MTKLLLAVCKIAEAGNSVLFNVDKKTLKNLAEREKIDENLIVNKATGKTSKINKEGGLYKYPIWTKREKVQEPPKAGNCERPAKKSTFHWPAK